MFSFPSLLKTFTCLAPYEQNVEYWTSGNNLGCDGRLRWCSTKINDHLKENLIWREPIKSSSCVNILLVATDGSHPQLGTADCDVKKRFICEVYYKCCFNWDDQSVPLNLFTYSLSVSMIHFYNGQ